MTTFTPLERDVCQRAWVRAVNAGRVSFGLSADDCWTWTGSHFQSGYGQQWVNGKNCKAHRVSYVAAIGPIPDGLVLDHLCRNHACVRPDHLEPVTDRVNVLRGEGPAAVNAAKTHCPVGHPLTRDNLTPYELKHRGRNCLACARERNRRYKQRKKERAA